MTGGFGPSTGRIVEVGESSGTRTRRIAGPMPPALGILVFIVSFLGLIFGVTLIHQDEVAFGVILLIVVVAIIALSVIRTVTTRR